MLHAELHVSVFDAKYRPFPFATVFTYSRLTPRIHASSVGQTLVIILCYNPSEDNEVTLVAFQNSMTRMSI